MNSRVSIDGDDLVIRVALADLRPSADRAAARSRVSGMMRDARALGVTRQHLRAVLAGRQHSRRLLKAYRDLHAAETNGAAGGDR